ncbi:hypothetical protein MLD38_030902 [Melastoma candidum]|uniref:Uncharacterized protein n=1 Tax=Melastoma candidum TaxID=119954 RepID=A0ACB9MN40_9MYRT|nr:hypothetical protein MLD38_030902 [Melastoma candidum]
MRWLHNHSRTATAPASASSSAPASPWCSFSLTVAMDFSINGLSSTGGPKLTRQTNLRYLSEKKILGALQQLHHVAEAGGDASTGAGAVVSMPLPLPLPPSSPEQATTSSTREDGAKVSQHADGTSSRASSKNLKGDKKSSRQNSRSSTVARSAPTSPSSIDAIRNSSNDFLQYYYITPKTNNVWSAPEIPTGNSFPIPHEQHAYSFEAPPLRSPQVKSPVGTSKNLGGSASSLHPKSSSTGRHDSNANAGVHPLPLPLPPSAALRSPSSVRTQASIMTETVPLKGQWKKGKLIGRGTFGSVYVASNRETGALCAMKEVELCPEDPKSLECIKQLEQEINVLSWLKHPNIVQYYGSETVDDRFYIYLEYVHPGSINKYVRDNFGAITESVVRNFTRHILSGLAYLHRKKTVHRDIKGANLLVDASGVVKLADFGMAKHLTGQAADLSLKGSPYWMAPELICSVMKNDNSDHAFAVDIWSLGCTIIEMITGKPPWSEFEGAAAMFRVLSDTPPIPDMLSSEGKDFLQCCFRRNPAERPSAAKLLDHRFLKSLSPLDLSFRGQPSFARKSEMPRSMRERAKAAVDKPILPSRSHNTKSKADHDSDPGWTPVFENIDLASVTRFSPRSILDTLPSLSLGAEQASINNHSNPSTSTPSHDESIIRRTPTFR